MPHTYILYSKCLNRFYIGSTMYNIESRLQQHLQRIYGSKAFTTRAVDWEIFWSIETTCLRHAQKMERHIKRNKSRVFIRNLVKYPELGHKIYTESLDPNKK